MTVSQDLRISSDLSTLINLLSIYLLFDNRSF